MTSHYLYLTAWVPRELDGREYFRRGIAELDGALRAGYDEVERSETATVIADGIGPAPQGTAGDAAEQHTQEWTASFGPDTEPVSVTATLWIDSAGANHEFLVEGLSVSEDELAWLGSEVTRIVTELDDPASPAVIHPPRIRPAD